jgi:Domain of Unknown Function (DUF1080)
MFQYSFFCASDFTYLTYTTTNEKPVMTNKALLLILAPILVFLSNPLYAQPEKGFVSMFNGKDLTGWEGLMEFWKAENGTLVGETKAANQQTVFLYWKVDEPADFEMRYRIRVVGQEGNSGVQIRSQRRPNWDALGYQADFDATGYCVGTLYHYNREPLATFAQRGDSLVIDYKGNRSLKKFADPEKLLDAFKKGDWNDYRILAKGKRVTLWVNGVLMCTVEDSEEKYTLPKGIIALQLHSGAPMRVEYKDLRIRIIK